MSIINFEATIAKDQEINGIHWVEIRPTAPKTAIFSAGVCDCKYFRGLYRSVKNKNLCEMQS